MTTRPLLIGLVLLSVLAVPRGDEAEDRAVQAVEKLGGKIIRDDKAPGKHVIAVDLRETHVTSGELKELAALKQLQSLDLRFTQVTDAGLTEVAALQQLRTLYLIQTPVTDTGVVKLAALQ